MTTLYVKPNLDKVLYLFSNKAIKTTRGSRTYEYRWDVPNMTLNDWGKMSLVSQTFKDFTTTPVIMTRILNVSTKDNFDTSHNSGTILNVAYADNLSRFNKCPDVYLAPQSINSITLSLTDDFEDAYAGVLESECKFVIVLQITEADLPVVEYGNKIMNNKTQMTIPTY
jgi:hypothetical protein